jgi:transposase
MTQQTERGKPVRVKRAEGDLPVVRPDAAGIDLGSREHYVAAPPRDGHANVRAFGTTTPELIAMADWLRAEGVQSVAMESTGVYWIPAYEVLEGRGFEVLLVDARQLKHVPGRKTDVIDCQWLQLLHSRGLLRGSFRPDDSVCYLRSLVREEATLVNLRADTLRRMQKSLDQMNVRVHHAVSDISGTTGMAMLRAIVAGERDPAKLAAFRNARCQKTPREMRDALTGNWREDHLFNLAQSLALYDAIQARLDAYTQEIARVLASWATQPAPAPAPDLPNPNKRKLMRARGQEPMRQALFHASQVDLTVIDGISVETAKGILSEVGPNLDAFPTERHFVAYLRLSPKLAISGGKPIRRRPKGSTTSRLGSILRMAATTLRNSQTALGAAYRRLARRKGPGVAVFATARKLAILVYRLLRHGVAYVDEGAHVYEARFREARLRMCQNVANQLGFNLVPQEIACGVSD